MVGHAGGAVTVTAAIPHVRGRRGSRRGPVRLFIGAGQGDLRGLPRRLVLPVPPSLRLSGRSSLRVMAIRSPAAVLTCSGIEPSRAAGPYPQATTHRFDTGSEGPCSD